MLFERTIAEVTRFFEREGLARILSRISRIRPVSEESFHDVRNLSIGLNPADTKKPWAAFHTRPYLLIHEIGHHFAEVVLNGTDRTRLRPVFGDYDAPYRRAPKPRRADTDHVSRYAMVHPAEDFAETFAVCLWRKWKPEEVEDLLSGKSPVCRRKVSEVARLLSSRRTTTR
jgi:hypothetical protein